MPATEPLCGSATRKKHPKKGAKKLLNRIGNLCEQKTRVPNEVLCCVVLVSRQCTWSSCLVLPDNHEYRKRPPEPRNGSDRGHCPGYRQILHRNMVGTRTISSKLLIAVVDQQATEVHPNLLPLSIKRKECALLSIAFLTQLPCPVVALWYGSSLPAGLAGAREEDGGATGGRAQGHLLELWPSTPAHQASCV